MLQVNINKGKKHYKLNLILKKIKREIIIIIIIIIIMKAI